MEIITKQPIPFCDFYCHLSYENKCLDEIRLCLRSVVRRQIMINRYNKWKNKLVFRRMSKEFGITSDDIAMIEEFNEAI